MVDQTYTPRGMGDYDAPHSSPVTPAEDVRTIMLNRISWGAVLAGVVAALVSQLILNMLGLGIGIATLDPGTGDNPAASTFSIAAAAWWIASGIVSAFIGGYAAGRLSGKPKESTTGWHGLTAWALSTLIVFYLLTSALGGIIGGVFNTVGGIGRTAVQSVPGVAQATGTSGNDAFAAIERQLRSATGANNVDTGAVQDATITTLRAALTGDPAQAQQAREQAAQAIARSSNVSIEEARARVARYEQQYRQTAQQATQVADKAASYASRGALFGSLALILGALAAWFGGRAGTVEPTLTSGALATTERRV